jgi:hypothetical protein
LVDCGTIDILGTQPSSGSTSITDAVQVSKIMRALLKFTVGSRFERGTLSSVALESGTLGSLNQAKFIII